MKALINGILYTGSAVLKDKALLILDGRVHDIVDREAVPPGAEVEDCRGAGIAPGLLDLQVYGGGGYLFSEKPSAEALQAMAESLVKSGTTGFLLTLATNSLEVFREAIRLVKQHPHPALLGIHFEGPYLNPVKKGAHEIKYIHEPTVEEVGALLEEAEGTIKMMTVAPECTSPEVIALLRKNGVIVSAGHSNATYAEAMRGFEQGVQAVTHLFNAMSPLHHRDTGLPGAAYQSGTAMASIIADGIHVDYEAVSISKKIMGERLFLITDAVDEAREGPYTHVRKEDRFTLPDGTLSGSNLSMLRAVQNCVEHAGIPLDESLRMASQYPAALLQRSDIGVLAPGSKADLVVFEGHEVRGVWMDGVKV